MASFYSAHKEVSVSEGGYTINPEDNGNWTGGRRDRGELIGTNFGISAPVLKAYLGRTPTAKEMYDLSASDAKDIYRKNYWDAIQGDDLKNQSVALMIYDSAVNQGVGTAKNYVLRALGEQEKEETYTAKNINKANQKKLWESIKQARRETYSRGQKAFREGWLKRLDELTFIPTNKKTFIIGILGISLILGGVLIYKGLKK